MIDAALARGMRLRPEDTEVLAAVLTDPDRTDRRWCWCWVTAGCLWGAEVFEILAAITARAKAYLNG